MGSKVTVIDYGMGNLLSVCRALEHLGAEVTLSHEPDVIVQADKLILPGVGAFGDGMNELNKRGLSDVLRDKANDGTPILGICLGAQMLLDSSEEFGSHQGLGLIPGRVLAIPTTDTEGRPLKVPHVGWSDLDTDHNHPLLKGIPTPSAVYFVHSFQCHPNDENDLITHCLLGGHKITAMVAHANIAGCQFHPEKSGPVGLRILANFLSTT